MWVGLSHNKTIFVCSIKRFLLDYNIFLVNFSHTKTLNLKLLNQEKESFSSLWRICSLKTFESRVVFWFFISPRHTKLIGHKNPKKGDRHQDTKLKCILPFLDLIYIVSSDLRITLSFSTVPGPETYVNVPFLRCRKWDPMTPTTRNYYY